MKLRFTPTLTRALTQRRRARTSLLSVVALTTAMVGFNAPSQAAISAGGSFTLDFTAAAPTSYYHAFGGGAYDDRTTNVDIVESLEGGDYRCGDIVTFLTHVKVDSGASAFGQMTIAIDYAFLMDTTGQSGGAFADITKTVVNSGTVTDLRETDTKDDGIVDLDGQPSSANLDSKTATGPIFTAGSVLHGTARITHLSAGESSVLRMDVPVTCKQGALPTGNLQADLIAARVLYVNGTETVPERDAAISAGNQTVPMKQFGNILTPKLTLVKTTNGTDGPQLNAGGPVTWEYVVTNTGTAALSNVIVTDDQPGVTVHCPATTLAVGASMTCSASGTAIQGRYDNIGMVTGDYGTASASAWDASWYYGNAATIDIQKTPDEQTVIYGETATFTIAVTNTSDVQLTDVAVDDPEAPNCNRSIGTLESHTTVTYSCTLPDVHVSFDNIASVEGHYGTATVTDTDTAHVTDDILPNVEVVKTVSPETVPETGGYVDYTYTVINANTEAFWLTSLIDDRLGDVTGQDGCQTGIWLEIAQTVTCSVTHIWVQGPAGSTYTNWVTVVATDLQGNTDTAQDDAIVTFTDVLPTLTLDKSVSPGTVPEIGGPVDYTLTVTNTGTVDVTITALTDNLVTLSTECLNLIGTTLTPGASTSCSINDVQLTGEAGDTYLNTANVEGRDHEGNLATANDDAAVLFTDVPPQLQIRKYAEPTLVPETGGNVTFSFEVRNIGEEVVGNLTLFDDVFGDLAGECALPESLAPYETFTCSFNRWLTSLDLTAHHDVATVTGVDDDGTPATASDDADVSFDDVLPTIVIDKSVSADTVPETGGYVDYTLTITNIGDEAVVLTALTDDEIPLSTECLNLLGTVLLAGGSTTCAMTNVWVEGDSGSQLVNLASVTGEDNEGNHATASDDATVTFTDVPPRLRITKTADPTEVPETGGDVTFTILIENIGEEAVTDLTLVDDVFGDLSGECALPESLADGGSFTCTLTRTLTSLDLTAHHDVVTVTGVDNEGSEATDSDDADVTFRDALPQITIVKTVSTESVPETGGYVDYTLTVTNTGAEALHIQALTDDHAALSTECLALIGAWLVPSGFATCTITHVWVQGAPGSATVNTANVEGRDNEENPATSSDTATVTFTDVLPQIAITKTANPASVLFSGGYVDYALHITNTGTVTVTLLSLSDDRAPLSAACLALIGTSLAPAASVDCVLDHVWVAGSAGGSVVNHATATGEDNEHNPASATDDATVTLWWYGRTPGYWKAHPAEWVGYSPSATLVSVFSFPKTLLNKSGQFDVVSPKGNDTLLQALDYKGGETVAGKAEILLRAATAALLNEAYYKDGYPAFATTKELITYVNGVLATLNRDAYTTAANMLNAWNNGNHAALP